MAVQPIKASEVASKKQETIPDAVINAFNQMIIAKWDGYKASFTQDAVVGLMGEKGLAKRQILDNHWLDVEELFEEAGWMVEYDKPGFNESYDATFTFKKKRKRARST